MAARGRSALRSRATAPAGLVAGSQAAGDVSRDSSSGGDAPMTGCRAGPSRVSTGGPDRVGGGHQPAGTGLHCTANGESAPGSTHLQTSYRVGPDAARDRFADVREGRTGDRARRIPPGTGATPRRRGLDIRAKHRIIGVFLLQSPPERAVRRDDATRVEHRAALRNGRPESMSRRRGMTMDLAFRADFPIRTADSLPSRQTR